MKSVGIILAGLLMSIFSFGQSGDAYQAKVIAPEYTDELFSSISDFLSHNIEYPQSAKTWGLQGKEVVRFKVNPDGRIREFKVINSVSPDIDSELVNLLKMTSGRWNPGRINGSPCIMEKEVVVVYKLHKSTDLSEIAKKDFRKANFLLYDKNDARKALRYYNRAVKFMPKDIALFRARMMCRFFLGDKEGALADRQRMELLAGDVESVSSEVTVMAE